MNVSAFLRTGVVLIALSAASMALFFSILLFRVLSYAYFLVIFLLTYAVYGMDRLASLEEDRLSHPERTRFLQQNRWTFALSIVLAFMSSLLLAVASGWVAMLIPLAPIAVVFYSGTLSQKVLGTQAPLEAILHYQECHHRVWLGVPVTGDIDLPWPPDGNWAVALFDSAFDETVRHGCGLRFQGLQFRPKSRCSDASGCNRRSF